MNGVDLAKLKLEPLSCGVLCGLLGQMGISQFIMHIGPDTPESGEYVLVDLAQPRTPFSVSYVDNEGNPGYALNSTLATLVKTSHEAIADVFRAFA